jgi:hypothetical protein
MSPEIVSTSLFDPAARHTPEWHLHWLFRLVLCAEFVGHGAFGLVMGKANLLRFYGAGGLGALVSCYPP